MFSAVGVNKRSLPALDLDFKRATNISQAVVRSAAAITYTGGANRTYFDANGVLTAGTTDVARFDHVYDGTTWNPVGLSVYEARTNLCKQSESFGTTWVSNVWGGGITLVENVSGVVAPDGTETADSIRRINGASDAIYQNITTATSTVYTASIFIKNIDGVAFTMLWSSDLSTNPAVTVTWSGGVPTSSSEIALDSAAIITNVGNNWYRLVMSMTSHSSDTTGTWVLYPGTGGSGTEGNYIWGAQMEAGAFPSPYVSTTTGTSLATADVATMTGTSFSSWYNQSEGTIFVQGSKPIWEDGAYEQVVQISNGTNDERHKMQTLDGDGTGQIGGRTVDGGVDQFSPATPTDTTADGETWKTAFTYAVNNFGIATNGGTVVTDTSGTLPTVDRIAIGYGLNGNIARITYWAERKDNIFLTAITGR